MQTLTIEGRPYKVKFRPETMDLATEDSNNYKGMVFSKEEYKGLMALYHDLRLNNMSTFNYSREEFINCLLADIKLVSEAILYALKVAEQSAKESICFLN